MAKSPQASLQQAQKPFLVAHWLAVAIVIVVAAAAYYVYTLYQSYGSLPASIASAVLGSKALNGSALTGVILKNVNAAQALTITYAGHVLLFSNSYPFTAVFQKSKDTFRVTFNATSIPIFNNTSVVTVLNNATRAAFMCMESSGYRLVQSGYGCIDLNDTNLEHFVILLADSFSFANGTAPKVSTPSLSTSSGQPCYLVSLSSPAQLNSYFFGTGNFISANFTLSQLSASACLSSKYAIPLSAEVIFASQASSQIAGFNFHLVSINDTAYVGNVSTLPGPVVPFPAGANAVSNSTQ